MEYNPFRICRADVGLKSAPQFIIIMLAVFKWGILFIAIYTTFKREYTIYEIIIKFWTSDLAQLWNFGTFRVYGLSASQDGISYV